MQILKVLESASYLNPLNINSFLSTFREHSALRHSSVLQPCHYESPQPPARQQSCSPVRLLRMHIPTLLRGALALAAVAAALVDSPQVVRAELPIIVTKTITPMVGSTGKASGIPEFVEVTTVGLTTVTVFGNESSSTETTITYTPNPANGSEAVASQAAGIQAAGSQPGGGQDPGNLSVTVTANATFLTDGPVNTTLTAVSTPTTVSETSTAIAVDPTAVTLVATTSPANTTTSSKNNAAVVRNW